MRFAAVGLLFVVALGAAGCRELNPSYCAVNRNDPDCFSSGVDLVDPPAMDECMTDSDCTTDAKAPACDPINHRCVGCVVGGNVSACAADETCGADQRCHGCITDGDCPLSGVCKVDQSCAAVGEVRYAIPDGQGDCSRTSPCSFSDAVSGLTQAQHIVKLLKTTSDTFDDDPITIDQPFPVQIIGKGITFKPDEDGDAITVGAGASVEILGLAIVDATEGAGLACSGGTVTLQEVKIDNPDGDCVDATDCDLHIKRSSFSHCGDLAMVVSKGTHEIRNNWFSDNVSAGDGTVKLSDVKGRFVFNTIVRTISPNGNKTAGAKCTGGGPFTLAQNLIVEFSDTQNAVSGCGAYENVPIRNFAEAGFVGTDDFHLTANSPDTDPQGIRDAQTMTALRDCQDAGDYIEDVDGVIRPYNDFCDRGADEYQPAQQ